MILFDEIEKAHPDVFNVLLQVLDDGRLTDGQGRTVDFRNTVIVMTSNLGSHKIQQMTDDGQRSRADQDRGDGRGEDAVPARSSSTASTRSWCSIRSRRRRSRSIARIQLRGARAAAGEARDQARRRRCRAEAHVAAAGFDPVYGARPLKRAIQQQIENPLAKEILSGKYAAGDTVNVKMAGSQIAFAKT